MGSQFVDFNADGNLDYLTATFDGSPHISYGARKGFGKPQRLLDAQGRRIIISSIWNYEAERHENLGHSMPDGRAVDERCISALAYDWDADGDFDLLLGSYEKGHLYRQMNEGTNARPAFTGKNIPVLAGGSPWTLDAKMTAPRLVDWDGDGDLDLLTGTFGETFGQKARGGGVYLSRNLGTRGKPAFGALEELIPPSPKGASEPTRPDAGLYPEALDWDGDGDLDLVVGGYSLWTPEGRRLSREEQAEVERLRGESHRLRKEQNALMAKVDAELKVAAKGLAPRTPEYRKLRSKVLDRYRDAINAVARAATATRERLGVLEPRPQRRAFVWLYERLPSENVAGGN